jgi:hypothetical protein
MYASHQEGNGIGPFIVNGFVHSSVDTFVLGVAIVLRDPLPSGYWTCESVPGTNAEIFSLRVLA